VIRIGCSRWNHASRCESFHPKGWAHHTFEFREPCISVSNTPASWFCPAVDELPRWHGVALAIADRAGLDVQSLELRKCQ